MTDQGTFNPGQQVAEDVLRVAATQSFSGRIDMTSATGDVASVWFEDGVVLASAVPGPRPRLGVRLLSAGLVRPEALDAALREQGEQADAAPMGDILVRDGAVDRDEVEHVVRVQMVDQVADLLGWDLIGTAQVPGDPAIARLERPIPVDELLRAAGIRREVWEEMVRRLGGPQGVPRPSMLAAPRANLLLGPYDWAVLTKVDGLRSLDMLADHCGLSIYETAQIIDALAQMGLLVVPPPPERQAAPPGRSEPRRRAGLDAASLLRELSALNRGSHTE